MGTQTIDQPTATNGSAAASGALTIPDGLIEIRKPSAAALGGYWGAKILDNHGVDPGSIISASDPFRVEFHVWLYGDLWRCICGDWCFDMHFESIGTGPELSLSDLSNLEPQLTKKDWKGCRELHFWVGVDCPPHTVPSGPKNHLYRVGATFQMLDPCGKPAAVVGYQPLGEVQFYTSH